jgi:hypothetical protein
VLSNHEKANQGSKQPALKQARPLECCMRFQAAEAGEGRSWSLVCHRLRMAVAYQPSSMYVNLGNWRLVKRCQWSQSDVTGERKEVIGKVEIPTSQRGGEREEPTDR